MQRLGPYELLGELGRGGMGAVYRARQEGERVVALKVLLSPLDAEERARFEREARVLAGFEHPNVIAVLDAGVSERGLPYLVLPLLPGSLHDRLRRGGPLPDAEAAEITRKLAQAVAYAHSRKILHRDLKPHNVLIDAAGEPVLTDFGLAQTRDDRITATGEVLGTPGYMSPEQAQGQRAQIGSASDVYGLGATLYAMLSGGPPFVGGSALAVLNRVVSEAPPPLPDTVDRGLAAICLRCLAKDPDERFGHADDLALALEVWGQEGDAPWAESRGGWLVPALVVAIGVAAVAMGLAVLWQGVAEAPARVGATSTALPAPPSPVVAPSSPVVAPSSPLVAPPPPPPPTSTSGAEQRAIAVLGRATRAMQRREWAHAEELMDEALSGGPTLQGLMMRAALHRERERASRELADLRQLVGVGPLPVQARLVLVKRLGELGDSQGQVRELERAFREGGEGFRPEERLPLIRLWMKAGRYAAALDLLNEETKRHPRRLELKRLYGECRWYLLHHKEGLRELRAWAQAAGKPEEIERYVTLASSISILDELPDLAALEARANEARGLMASSPLKALALLEQVPRGRRPVGILRLAGQAAAKARLLDKGIEYLEEALRLCTVPAVAASIAEFTALVHLGRRKRDGIARALLLLNRAIDLDPRPTFALEQRGSLRFRLGFLEEAFADSRRALKLGRRSPLVLVGLGWEAFFLKRYEEARALHLEALELEKRPTHRGPAAEGAGVALVALERYAEAREKLDQAIQLEPGLWRARFARATVLRKEGNWGAAREDHVMALSVLPATHPERAMREDEEKQARVRFFLHRFQQAKANKNRRQAFENAGSALALHRSANTLTAQAMALWGLGKKNQALTAQQAAVDLAPRRPKLRKRLAHMLEVLEDPWGALREREVQLRLDPKSFDADARRSLAWELVFRGRQEEALRLAESELKATPGSISLLRLRYRARWLLFRDRAEALAGLERIAQGRGPEAEKARKDLVPLREAQAGIALRRLRPGDRRVRQLVEQATRRIEVRDFSQAEGLLERAKAIRAAPIVLRAEGYLAVVARRDGKRALVCARDAFQFASSREEAMEGAWLLAQAHLIRGELRVAVDYLNRVIDFGGRLRTEALLRRARLRFFGGHVRQAFRDYREALAVDPKSAAARVGRGWEHYWAGRYREALTAFESVPPDARGPSASTAREGRAVTLVAQGQLERALPLFRGLVEPTSKRFLACFALAQLRWERGDRAGAIKTQEAGLTLLHPTHALRSRHVRALRRMRRVVEEQR